MSIRRETVQDVMCLAVPDYVDPSNEVSRAFFVPTLDILTRKLTTRQYEHHPVPPELEFEKVDWLITKDPADVEKFQPAHDCAACRAGNDQSLAFLRENPGRYIAMGNLTYTEIWHE